MEWKPNRSGPNLPPRAAGRSRAVLIASLLLLTAYFAVPARPGLHAYFTQDDGGNLLHMHKYWENSLGAMVSASLRVVTGAYRPLGGIYYFVLYRLFGFNPAPFRIVALALMLGNVWLAFAVLLRLSGLVRAALFGAILMVNHPAVLELLYSSGTIYEILAFFFYFLCLLCYVSWRESAQRRGAALVSWPRLAAVLALTGAALDSKEMAMTLPVALLLIECIYFPPRGGSWSKTFWLLLHQSRAVLLTAALVIPTIAVKILTANPLSNDPRYAAHTPAGAINAYRGYQRFLLYRNLYRGGLSAPKLVAPWIAMTAIAIVLRSRPMKFALAFLIMSMLPVCLIAPRSGYISTSLCSVGHSIWDRYSRARTARSPVSSACAPHRPPLSLSPASPWWPCRSCACTLGWRRKLPNHFYGRKTTCGGSSSACATCTRACRTRHPCWWWMIRCPADITSSSRRRWHTPTRASSSTAPG